MLYVISACFSLLINVDGVGSVGARVRGWRKSNLGVDAVGAVSQNFGVDCVGQGVLSKRCYQKFCKIFRKTPVLESLVK